MKFPDEAGRRHETVSIKEMLRCPGVVFLVVASVCAWVAVVLMAMGNPSWRFMAKCGAVAFSLALIWDVYKST